jgi:putative dimethyl sulfoxide reductase chaperone
VNEIAEAIADDAESLAALHDRELTAAMIAALREANFPAGLGLVPMTAEAIAAWRAMADGVTELPRMPDAATLDDLAAEYAAIYLTGAYGASPCESVWTDDDHLTCQAAMFQWRDIHAAAGLATPDWRQRPDDHLVLQVLYVANAARRTATADFSNDSWRKLAQVLDEHTLRWLPDFAARVAARSASSFYAGLAVLTAAWLDTVRDLIAAQLNEPRPSREELEARLQPTTTCSPIPVAFMPGTGPSW